MLPRIEEAKAGKREVWFVDASHFLYGAVLGFLWCAVRLWLPSPTGRRRYNVLGALNAVSREVRWVGGAGKVTAELVVSLLKKLTHGFDGPPVPGPKVTDDNALPPDRMLPDGAAMVSPLAVVGREPHRPAGADR